jgi:hypothetical protein
MTAETRKRRNYMKEFKRDAVGLVTEQCYKPSEAAQSQGIGDNLIRRWKREFEEEPVQLNQFNASVVRIDDSVCVIPRLDSSHAGQVDMDPRFLCTPRGNAFGCTRHLSV